MQAKLVTTEWQRSLKLIPSTENIQLLLANGADVNAKDVRGETVLHIAPSKEISKLFLVRGLNVNVNRNDGATPLHLAAVYGRHELVDFLIASGANVNAVTKGNITPLHYAKGPATVSRLLSSGAKPNATDEEGNSPLHLADEPSVAKLLINAGVEINLRNIRGQTPLLRTVRTIIENLPAHELREGPLGNPIVAMHGGNIEVLKALIASGAQVNQGDQEMDPPNPNRLPVIVEKDKDPKNIKMKTAPFYIREAKSQPRFSGVSAELSSLERLLISSGAK